MKKNYTKCIVCLFIACLCNVQMVGARSNENSATSVLIEFDKLQQEINDTLEIKDGKYIYDEVEITNIVEKADLDFDSLSKITNTVLTKESFLNDALNQIKNTEPKIVYSENSCTLSTRGSYCGRNASEEGWNYVRKYSDKTNSEIDRQDWWNLYQRNMNKYHFDTIRDIQDLVPSYARIAIGLSSVSAAAETSMAINLAGVIGRNNTGKCGTVIDINKYTRYVSGWSQDNFYI